MSNLHQAVYQVASNPALLGSDSPMETLLQQYRLTPNEVTALQQLLHDKTLFHSLFCSKTLGQKAHALIKEIEELWVPDADKS